MIIMIDNYDSFTYNVYQAMASLYNNIKVFRNDEITIEEIEKMAPEALVISPGPSYPKDAGISVAAIKHFAGKLPILGICLGHQSIGEAFGGKVVKAAKPMHGKSSEISINTDCKLFAPHFRGTSRKNILRKIPFAYYRKRVYSRMPEDNCRD